MGLREWWSGKKGGTVAAVSEWRRAWAEAAEAPDAERIAALVARLDALGLSEDEVEIEREMLDALGQLSEMRSSVDGGGLPTLDTQHRVIASDTCHFSAPVSMPELESQPSGRLLLTNARAIFVGGAKATSLAWHAIAEVIVSERDLVLVRHDRETLYRFRCNSYGDAMCGGFLARRLARSRADARPRNAR